MIPHRVLFGPPDYRAPALSPDGSRLAYLAPVDNVVNVWTGPIGGPYEALTASTQRGVDSFRWGYDGRHLLYLVDRAGEENWHLHAVDLRTGQDRDLTPFDGAQALLVATEPRRPDEVLVAINRDDPARHDAYRIDLRDGGLTLAARDEGFGTINGTWLADAILQVRAALRPTVDGGAQVLVRTTESQPWRVAVTVGLADDVGTRLVTFDATGQVLYLVTSAGGDTNALCRLDLAGGELTVVYADADHDVAAVAIDPIARRPRWVTVERERAAHIPLDEDARGDLAAISDVDGGDTTVLDMDRADRRWLLRSVRDDRATHFFLYDRDSATFRSLFADRPALVRYRLPQREPFTVSARDGLVLPGYLTFPLGVPRHDLPTVLLVHGGPWTRDRWPLDPDALWLADRGYLVAQVNFRGSTGYGKRFVAAADREWGAAMQDDLVDTVRLVTGKGWADPARVAIFGGSYGGYAALMGAALTPELFRCAVDICGPSDLQTLLRGIPPYWESLRALWNARVGDPDADEELLRQRSPIAHADRMTVPVLIAQGGNDARVPRRESDQIVAALRARGVEHEYLIYPDEGHYGFELRNELHLVDRIERFLVKYLGSTLSS